MIPRLKRKLVGGPPDVSIVPPVPPPAVRQVKLLIWVYFWLLLFEGALRKWVLPSLSDPLLLIRDPVVLLIYIQAIRGGFFPRHWLVKTTIWMGILTFFWGCIHIVEGNYRTLIISAFGVRCYFMHLPLIFLMGQVFRREDVLRVGKWCLIVAVPMAFLMAAQYKVDNEHWLNKATTGEGGLQLQAALGHVRPPGTFSFIIGPALFYPLVTAFIIYGVMRSQSYHKLLLAAAAGATVLMLPVSGSRSFVLGCSVVVAMAAVVLVRMPRSAPRFAIGTAVIVLLGLVLLTLPVGKQAVESFSTRWASASDSEGQGEGAEVAISKRVGGGFTEVFHYLDIIPLSGYGIGMGTNVGVKLMTGGVGYIYGESEWTRNVMEAGPIVGFAYIGFRLMLTGYLLMMAWKRIGQRDPLPWLIMGCAVTNLILGQTSQSTSLGFMVFVAGLSLSSAGEMRRQVKLSENQRLRMRHWNQKPQAGDGRLSVSEGGKNGGQKTEIVKI